MEKGYDYSIETLTNKHNIQTKILFLFEQLSVPCSFVSRNKGMAKTIYPQ